MVAARDSRRCDEQRGGCCTEDFVNATQLDLSIGETVRVGEYLVTVEDIEGEEIRLKVDSLDGPFEIQEEPQREPLPPR
ncbi:MAG: hypothetical protein DWQ34_08110 [Planctomycetota bacterium]|nr:MAG: hypothetical protein DWQ29_18585 [Planctomycetota bacterium]REJ94691.1 MAG: hypothetical protein DWQ34_08110 [Planctomycetota bacterium]REK31349.1 MAG: hypothetical protein DWQ41_00425 [Planctomycetota bacterium]REK39074.1 MAG: hypothetical protein DWQ45_02465 [Planctomycetota bacterium]